MPASSSRKKTVKARKPATQPHAAALEGKTLLENLQLIDGLLASQGQAGNRVIYLGLQRSVLGRLAALHGLEWESLANRTLSGAGWVSKFPDSKSTADLAGTFASAVEDFIDAMKSGGASIAIGTTLRPTERAYLMHYAFRIANDQIQPAAVPPMNGVNIEWDHGNAAASKKAAKDMVDGYDIVAKPALNSRHTEGKAIDMTITWAGTLNVKNKSGTVVAITTTPRNGENVELVKVGKSYGVIKATFAGDPPHWSTDGH